MIEDVVQILPPSIIPIVFLAYIIWSKFYNRGKLKIKNVDDILLIINLTIFLLVVLFTIIYTVSMLIANINLEKSFILIPQWQTLLILIVVYFLLIISLTYFGEKTGLKDLKKIWEFGLIIYIALLMITFTCLLINYMGKSEFLSVLKYKLLVYGFFLSIISIYYGISLSKIFKQKQLTLDDFNYQSKNKSKYKSLKLIIVIIGISAVIGIFLAIFPSPEITDYQEKIINYNLINLTHAYENVERIYNISKYGKIGLVSLEYDDLIVDENSSLGVLIIKEISPKILSKSDINYLKRLGIEDYRIDHDSSSFFVKYDPDKLKKAGVYGFLIKGKRIADISRDFYIKILNSYCSEKMCHAEILIVNNKNYMIICKNLKRRLFNKQIISRYDCCKSNITLTNYSYIQDGKKYKIMLEYHQNGEISISGYERTPSFYLYLERLEDICYFDFTNGSYSKIEVPPLSKIYLNITFLCFNI